MRFVRDPGAERTRDQHVARHVTGPRLAERTGDREQHRTRRQRDHRARVADDVPAGVDDERLRGEHRFDLREQEPALVATGDQARRRRGQDFGRALDLGESAGMRASRAARLARSIAARAVVVRRRRIAIPATTSSCAVIDAAGNGAGSSVASSRSASSRRPIRSRAPDLEMPRMRGIQSIAMRFERRARGVERFRRPAEVARDERDLGLGDDAPRPRHDLARTEAAGGAAHQGTARGRDRRAAPSRCLAAPAPARRHAARRASAPRADRPPRARAPRP